MRIARSKSVFMVLLSVALTSMPVFGQQHQPPLYLRCTFGPDMVSGEPLRGRIAGGTTVINLKINFQENFAEDQGFPQKWDILPTTVLFGVQF
jgi:hypothetical protein